MEPAPSEAEDLRARADRCRRFAKEYASDVGNSLVRLAAELDLRADQIDARPSGIGDGG